MFEAEDSHSDVDFERVESVTCGVCEDEIAVEGSRATQCMQCELVQCNECLVEWAKTCVKKIYVGEGKDLPPLNIPCAK